jgi:Protein of unknown function (DUF4238)
MTTRRQHYVWQKYLEPWTVQKRNARQIWCLRRGARDPFLVDTKNVAVERDFYRIQAFEKADGEFVRWLAFGERTNQKLRELNETFIAGFEALLRVHKVAKAHPKTSLRLRDALDAYLIEHEEQQYSRMETRAVVHLSALQAGGISFFDDDDQAVSFCHFLAHQYFRTKAIRDRIRETFDSAEHKNRFDRTWPIFRNVFATNVGYAIFSNRKRMKLQVVQSPPTVNFITADQPAVNTYGAFVAPDTPLEELELYYPVSPTRALIVSGHSVYQDVHGAQLQPFRALYLNQIMEHIAYEQLFASSEGDLRHIAGEFAGMRVGSS